MEEAYVIGIRLALEDGISAGLAAIRGELATLDIAIAATAAHLVQLQAMAVVTNLHHLATVGENILAPTPQPAPAPAPQPFERTPDLQTAPSQFTPSPSAPATLLEPGGPAERSLHQQPSSPATSPSAASPALPPPVSAYDKPINLSVETKQPVALAPPHAPVPEPQSRAEAPHSPIITILSPPPAAPVVLTGSSPTLLGPSRAPAHPNSFPAPQGRPEAHQQRVDATPVWHSPEDGRHVYHPPPPPSAAPRPQPPVAPVAPHTVARSSQSQQSQNSSPTGGAVFLDGHYVGHWIADHLARETARPSAGTAAFDPRLTPSYPGALQGN